MTKKKRILLADDDVQYVASIQLLLENAGFDVSHTYRPEHVLELARKLRPDLILLDVMFAGRTELDGFELSRFLHADSALRDIPVIIISGYRKIMALSGSLEPDDKLMPVAAFLEKPILPDQLLSEIDKALKSH